MAQHLAFNTAMSIDEAKAMLAVAAPETSQAAAPAAAPAAAASTNADPFKAAMNADKQPNVGDNGTGGEEAKPGTTSSLLQSAKLAGVKI